MPKISSVAEYPLSAKRPSLSGCQHIYVLRWRDKPRSMVELPGGRLSCRKTRISSTGRGSTGIPGLPFNEARDKDFGPPNREV